MIRSLFLVLILSSCTQFQKASYLVQLKMWSGGKLKASPYVDTFVGSTSEVYSSFEGGGSGFVFSLKKIEKNKFFLAVDYNYAEGRIEENGRVEVVLTKGQTKKIKSKGKDFEFFIEESRAR